MGALSPMVSTQLDRYQRLPETAIKPHSKDPHGVSLTHRYILALRLAGHAVQQEKNGKPSICELTNLTPATIYRVLGREDVAAMRDILLEGYESEFKTLAPKVYSLLEQGLEGDPLTDSQLETMKLWLKYNKVVPKEAESTTNLTAEQIVFNILNQPREEV